MMQTEFSFPTTDGLTMRGFSLFPKENCKAVIALIHGMGEHSLRYLHVAQFFANHGIATMGIDLRGHGKSDGKRGHTPNYDSLMNDIEKFLGKVKKEFPNLPLIIYGHSMGGNLTLNYLFRRQPNLNAAIVTSPYLKLAFEPPKWKVVLGKLSAGIVPTLSQPTGLETTAISRDKKVVKAYEVDELVHDKITSAFFVNVHIAGPYAIENAAKIKTPLLLMHGLEDQLTSPEGTKEFMLNAGANVTVKYWPGLFHEIHNEPEQEEVLQTELNWLLENKIV
jgi:alpha-beta hydrolase superfamily lysophospholipase